MRRILFVLLVAWSGLFPAWSQESPTASPTPTPIVAPASVPLGEVSTAARDQQDQLRSLETELRNDNLVWTIQAALPPLTREIESRSREDARVLQSRPDLDTLHAMQASWSDLRSELPGWRKGLASRLERLSAQSEELGKRATVWSTTLEAAQQAGLTADVLEAIRQVQADLERVQQILKEQQRSLLALQNAVASQDARIGDALKQIVDARTQTVSRVLVQDSPPFWSYEVISRLAPGSQAGAGPGLAAETLSSLVTQVESLKAYASRMGGKLLGPMLFFFLAWLVIHRIPDSPDMGAASFIVQRPAATALLLAVLLGRWLDPSAPRLLAASLGTLALVPAVLLLRRLLEPNLWPILRALLLFCLADQLRIIAAPVPLVARLILLAEGLAGVLFAMHFLQRNRELPRWLRRAMRVVMVLFGVVALADAIGFVVLANLIGNALLGGAYLAAILYGFLKIMDGLLLLGTRVPPVSTLRMVRNHGDQIRRRCLRVLQFLTLFAWTMAVLDMLSVRAPVLIGLRNVLQTEFGVGSLHLTLGRILSCALIVWLAVHFSRFLRFAAQEDVYPHLRLGRGVPYALSRGIHYSVLFLGILTGLAALGVDTTKFTVVAGALSVGIGFGLQNIVNNFVSGIILLVDRPVNVGDTIKLGDFQGKLGFIGLRSSTLVIGDGSEVIIPNSDLINQRVVNWSVRGNSRKVSIRMWLPSEADQAHALVLMADVASDSPGVSPQPRPEAFLVGYHGSQAQLQLDVWVKDLSKANGVKSELSMRVRKALEEAGFDPMVSLK